MGLVVIAEPIGYIIYLTLAGGVFEHEIVGYYFVVFVMEVFLLLVVELFCKIKAGKNVRVSLLPKEIAYTLELIPFASVVSCFLLIEIAGEIMSADTMILCMCVIFSIVVTNYIVFLMVHKYTGMAEKRLEEEMIYQEIAYNNEYYQDVEKYQEQIQDIKHFNNIMTEVWNKKSWMKSWLTYISFQKIQDLCFYIYGESDFGSVRYVR